MQRALLGVLIGLAVGCGPTNREPVVVSTSDQVEVPLTDSPSTAVSAAPALSAAATPELPEWKRSHNLDELWTTQGMETLKGATRVEAFRVDPSREAKANDAWIGGYVISATGKEQGKEFAAKLSAVLLSPTTYSFLNRKRCMFVPGVAYRFWKDQEVVEVTVCFHCDDLMVLVKDGSGKMLHYSGSAFDDARAEMVALARQAFPGDDEVQSMSPKRK